MTDLYTRLHEVFPSADPWWSGQPNYDGAVIEWLDGHMVVTPEDDGYMLGVYADWHKDPEAAAYLDIPTADRVVEIIDYLTENQSEGTNWVAWAAQRIDDDGLEMDR